MKRTEGLNLLTVGAASWLQMWMKRHRSDALSRSEMLEGCYALVYCSDSRCQKELHAVGLMCACMT